MNNRRGFLKFTTGSVGLLASGSAAAYTPRDLFQYLCPPDNLPDQLSFQPSPKAEPFKAELFIPPVLQPMPVAQLEPKADPRAHQLWDATLYGQWKLTPEEGYVLKQREFFWQYHPDGPYKNGSAAWGWEGPEGWRNDLGGNSMTPGPVIHATYGHAVLVRQVNELPPVGNSVVNFPLPSTSIHLHNGHTASESDGNPQDWIDSGEFWDHHYGNFPSGGDETEKLATLWYHDHRLDFTSSNVYAGLSGFYFLFDEFDSGNENDPNPKAWRLPSGVYDVPLMIHDVLFDEAGQPVFNNFYTDGWLGDQITFNRRIRPRFTVERRKYRFRIINGGPSRFYQFGLSTDDPKKNPNPFVVITGDGNFLPEPLLAKYLFMSVAQRYDVVIDFSRYKVGERVILWNMLEQSNGKGPSGRMLKEPDGVLAFDVVEAQGEDPSRIPDSFRRLPAIPENVDKLTHRTWDFDYDGGLWTINGLIMDPNRIDAGIVKGSAEVWTFRNTGNDWSHPVHCHFTEFIILEVNGKPYKLPDEDKKGGFLVQSRVDGDYQFIASKSGEKQEPIELFMGGPRRDVSTILPGDEMKVLLRFMDFEGRHVMHCHNVVHEDHAMMIRWDILPESVKEPILHSVPSSKVWKDGFFGSSDPNTPEGRAYSFNHLENHPATATYVEPPRGKGNFPPQAPKDKK